MRLASTQRVAIEEFCITGSGGTPSRSNSDYYGGDIPWVKSGELRESIIWKTEETITEEALRKSSAKIVPQGAILLAMYGATVGRLAMLGVDAATNQAVCNIRPDPSKADAKYLYRALEAMVLELISQATGGAQPNISQEKVRKTRIPLPPLDEQKRIAAILDKADALRAKRRQAIALLDSLTQSIFLDMFGEELFCEESAALWPLSELLTEKLQNGAYFPKDAYSSEPDSVPMVHMSDAFYGSVDASNLKMVKCSNKDKEKFSLNAGDLLVARRSLNVEGAAKPCRISKTTGAMIFESSLIRVRPDPTRLEVDYLYEFLSNQRARAVHVNKYITQSTISGINQSNLEKVMVLVPPMDQQREFVSRSNSVAKNRALMREDLRKIDSLFASIQHRAFTGQL